MSSTSFGTRPSAAPLTGSGRPMQSMLAKYTTAATLLYLFYLYAYYHSALAHEEADSIVLRTAKIVVQVSNRAGERIHHRILREAHIAPLDSSQWGMLRHTELFLLLLETTLRDVQAPIQEIERIGGRVTGFIPDHSLLVLFPRSQLLTLRSVAGVNWVGDYLPEHKVAPEWRPLLEHIRINSAASLSVDDSSGGGKPHRSGPFEACVANSTSEHDALRWQNRMHWLATNVPAQATYIAKGKEVTSAEHTGTAATDALRPHVSMLMAGDTSARHSHHATTAESLENATREMPGEEFGREKNCVFDLENTRRSSTVSRSEPQSLDSLLHPESANTVVKIRVNFPGRLLLPESAAGLVAKDGEVGEDAGEAALRDWSSHVEGLCSRSGASAKPCSKLERVSDISIVITVPASSFQAVLEWLAHQPPVYWISPAPKLRVANFFATGITQDSEPGAVDLAGGTSTPYADTHSFTEAGLQGQNQVIGIGDTGLDFRHCLLKDAGVPFSGFQTETGRSNNAGAPLQYFDSTTHRKIRYYRGLGDFSDGNSHGTHCAASIAGSLQAGTTSWQGMAPQAKLAFQDVGSGTSGSLQVPGDLTRGYFPFTYARGARVHSDSWGSSGEGVYDSLAIDFDIFTWNNQDFLPVVAAGNFGAQDADSTVSSPSTAKNCLSVGATLTAPYRGYNIEQEQVGSAPGVYQINMTGGQPGSGMDGSSSIRVLLATGISTSSVNFQAKPILVLGAPADGCAGWGASRPYLGLAVLLQRGNCSYSLKAQNIAAAGAVVALISNNNANGYFRLTPSPGAQVPAVPIFSVPFSFYTAVQAAVQLGATLTLQLQPYTPPSARFDSLAYFSSIGPTNDGRFKPDITAPGTSVSATPQSLPGSSCSSFQLAFMRGTSMATPVAAGAALLARQYFTEGWYPTGAPVAANAFNPSGALIKAVLIGGAANMLGVSPNSDNSVYSIPLEAAPSTRQGFGRVALDSSLPLPESSFNLQVVNGARMGSTGSSSKFCLRGQPGNVTVTLAWHDYPGSETAAKALVNDLDLTVHADALGPLPLQGNGRADRLNNVEKVTMTLLRPSVIAITVSAIRLFTAQPYSLAVHGSFNGTLASASNPAYTAGVVPVACGGPVTTILTAPARYTGRSNASFTFSADSDAPNGFQCQLLRNGAASPPPQYNWTSCSNPRTAANLGDGVYSFSARATGFTAQDSRTFSVDTVRPTTNITFYQVGAPQRRRAAAFFFTAIDASPTTAQCRLEGTDSSGVVFGAQSLGTWEACISPKVYNSMSSGGWLFSVRATDAAGNVEASPPVVRWTLALGSFAQISEAVPTVVQTRRLSFPFSLGGGGGDPGRRLAQSQPGFECALQTYSASSGSFSGPSFVNCSSPAVYSNLERGTYQFMAQVLGGPSGQPAVAQSTVNADLPVASITAAPSTPLPSRTASFSFSGSEGTNSFQCQLYGSAVADGNYTACTSPRVYAGLLDGSYTFRVVAETSSSEAGNPATRFFVIDTTPPAASNFSAVLRSGGQAGTGLPVAVVKDGFSFRLDVPTRTAFAMLFNASDGVLGSGVSPVNGSAGWGPADNPVACASGMVQYNLNNGIFNFSVQTRDLAGNSGVSATTVVAVGGYSASPQSALLPSLKKYLVPTVLAAGGVAVIVALFILWRCASCCCCSCCPCCC